MAQWDSALYLKYRHERTQPSRDLAARLPAKGIARILDVGCGPGNSTHVLRRRYPEACIFGIDSSENMIGKARQSYPQENWQVCTVPDGLRRLPHDFDLVFSNACIQWIPDHAALISSLLGSLRHGGILAVQMPMNFKEPVHRIIEAVIRSKKWDRFLSCKRIFHTLAPEEYYSLLSGISSEFSIWQTTYYHIMDSIEDIMDWYRGTGLLPYLEQLKPAQRIDFEADIRMRLLQEYPPQPDGKVIFRFPRFFFTAVK